MERLAQISELLGFTLAELLQTAASSTPSLHTLTIAQEAELVADEKLPLVTVCALNHLPLAYMVEGYQITAPEVTKRLRILDCMGLIELLPGDRIRRRVRRAGIASFYAARFGGRTMADGTPMRLNGDNAASRTLPLGTKALVTNLDTGMSSHVTIRDRGPYVGGRLVDLSPGTARKIGLGSRQGLARVVVTPISIPLADGSVKRGDASDDS